MLREAESAAGKAYRIRRSLMQTDKPNPLHHCHTTVTLETYTGIDNYTASTGSNLGATRLEWSLCGGGSQSCPDQNAPKIG